MDNQEIWKPVVGYEGYYDISNLGQVKRLERSVNGRALKPRIIPEKIVTQHMSSYGHIMIFLSRNGKQKSIYLHQLLAEAFMNHTRCGYKVVVDHIDNDKLNNRLDNLQLVSNRENCSKDRKNKTSKFRGVCWNKKHSKWVAQLYHGRKHIWLGYFKMEKDAAKAYQDKLEEIIKS